MHSVQPAISIRTGTSADAQQITDLMNIVLMADDTWFKEPAYVNRITVGETFKMMYQKGPTPGSATGATLGPTVRFLVAEEAPGAKAQSRPSSTLVGCVRMAMPTVVPPPSAADDAPLAPASSPNIAAAAQLGMLAVAPGGRGIGTLLINAAEKSLEEAAAEALEQIRSSSAVPRKQTLRIIVPVFSERRDLLAFYAECGYQPLLDMNGEPEKHPEFSKVATTILNEEWVDRVQLQMFYKDVEIGGTTGGKVLAQTSPIGVTRIRAALLAGVVAGSGVIFAVLRVSRRLASAGVAEPLLVAST
jgi:GNAT superfamily N-acetyltransferase